MTLGPTDMIPPYPPLVKRFREGPITPRLNYASMRVERALIALCLLATVSACSGSRQSGSASPSPGATDTTAAEVSAAPESAAPAAPVATGPETSAASASAGSAAESPAAAASGAPGSPTPAPTPSPYANLLDSRNGAIVRSYPASFVDDPNEVDEHGAGFKAGSAGPYSFVYELPGVATLTSFKVWMPSAVPSEKPTHVTIAVSTSSATSGFTDAASQTATADLQSPVTLPVANVAARWVRVTVDGVHTVFNGVYAFGTLAPRPASAPGFAGIYMQQRKPYPDGGSAFDPSPPPSSDPWYVDVVDVPGGIGGQ